MGNSPRISSDRSAASTPTPTPQPSSSGPARRNSPPPAYNADGVGLPERAGAPSATNAGALEKALVPPSEKKQPSDADPTRRAAPELIESIGFLMAQGEASGAKTAQSATAKAKDAPVPFSEKAARAAYDELNNLVRTPEYAALRNVLGAITSVSNERRLGKLGCLDLVGSGRNNRVMLSSRGLHVLTRNTTKGVINAVLGGHDDFEGTLDPFETICNKGWYGKHLSRGGYKAFVSEVKSALAECVERVTAASAFEGDFGYRRRWEDSFQLEWHTLGVFSNRTSNTPGGTVATTVAPPPSYDTVFGVGSKAVALANLAVEIATYPQNREAIRRRFQERMTGVNSWQAVEAVVTYLRSRASTPEGHRPLLWVGPGAWLSEKGLHGLKEHFGAFTFSYRSVVPLVDTLTGRVEPQTESAYQALAENIEAKVVEVIAKIEARDVESLPWSHFNMKF